MNKSKPEKNCELNYIRGSDNLFPCPLCPKRFQKKSLLIAHHNIHLNKKEFKCHFENCLASYARAAHLKRHVSATHSSSSLDLNFKCHEKGCVAAFSSTSNLAQHARRTHFKNNSHTCSKCSESFSSLTQLNSHIALSHPRELSLKKNNQETSLKETKKTDIILDLECSICHKKLSSPANYKKHLETHEKEREVFKCTHENCDKFYFHEKNLTAHKLKSHTQQPSLHACHICSKSLSTKQKLSQHVKIHEENYEENKRKRRQEYLAQLRLKTLSRNLSTTKDEVE